MTSNPADVLAIAKTTRLLLGALPGGTSPRIVIAALARLTASAIKTTGDNPERQIALFTRGVRDELSVMR